MPRDHLTLAAIGLFGSRPLSMVRGHTRKIAMDIQADHRGARAQVSFNLGCILDLIRPTYS